jgi:hypothetical protein
LANVGPCSALAYRYAVEADDPGLARHGRPLLAAMKAPGAAPAERIVLHGPAEPRLVVDGETVAGSTTVDRLLPSLFWHLNQRAVASLPDHLLLHAGAVAAGSMAILLPAPMESGKTTLTAGLVQRGLDYVTDEAVAIDPATLGIVPYPKPLSIDQGSWEVLPELRPKVSKRLQALHAFQWQVAPDAIRPGCLAGPCWPGLIVSPLYDPSSPTQLTPISRSQAVVLLAENSFNFRDRGRHLLPVIAAVVRRCECYRLTVNDLPTACAEILRLAGATARVPA